MLLRLTVGSSETILMAAIGKIIVSDEGILVVEAEDVESWMLRFS